MDGRNDGGREERMSREAEDYANKGTYVASSTEAAVAEG